MINLKDPSYLLSGTQRQMDAYHALLNTGVFSILRRYDPALVGAIPLGIQDEQPDLRIICQVNDFSAFRDKLEAVFGKRQGFEIKSGHNDGSPTVVAGFSYGGFLIAISGEDRPVTEQAAFQLTLVQARLLDLGGERARRGIKKLKEEAGLDTQTAIARYFHIEGDPSEALLGLSALDEEVLQVHIEQQA